MDIHPTDEQRPPPPRPEKGEKDNLKWLYFVDDLYMDRRMDVDMYSMDDSEWTRMDDSEWAPSLNTGGTRHSSVFNVDSEWTQLGHVFSVRPKQTNGGARRRPRPRAPRATRIPARDWSACSSTPLVRTPPPTLSLGFPRWRGAQRESESDSRESRRPPRHTGAYTRLAVGADSAGRAG